MPMYQQQDLRGQGGTLLKLAPFPLGKQGRLPEATGHTWQRLPYAVPLRDVGLGVELSVRSRRVSAALGKAFCKPRGLCGT